MTLESKLADLGAAGDGGAHAPLLFDLSRAADRAALDDLVASGAVASAHDRIDAQLRELIANRNASRRMTRAELDERAAAHVGGTARSEYGRWVYFPWSRRVVHVLPEAEYRELRSARNRYKITAEEQERLRRARVGIVGLSVGQASAVTFALEGIGGELRLADFDELDLSNMNRLHAPVHALGVNKCVIAARTVAEIDPYVRVQLFREGLRDDNLDAFLSGEGGAAPLDLVLEECDDLFMKLRVRERARELRIPVVMETTERGMLDIERYDREPERAAFHGLVGGVRAETLRTLSAKEKVPHVLAILGTDGIGPRAVASLMEVSETVTTWPQLASSVALGSALSAEAARRVLLDKSPTSGRWFVDLDVALRDEKAILKDGTEAAPPSGRAVSEDPPPLARTGAPFSHEDIRRIVAYGTTAPSGGNAQPWRFIASGARIRCLIDPARATTLLDFEQRASVLAVAAAAEGMCLAARAMGYSARIERVESERETVCDVILDERNDVDTEARSLAALLPLRATNRRSGHGAPLQAEHAALLRASVPEGARLQLVTDHSALEESGRILGAIDKVRFLSRRMHAELMSEVRWTREETERTRDGIDVATLEIARAEIASMRLASSFAVMEVLRAIGGGGALEKPSREGASCASAIGLLTARGRGRAAYLDGGRALLRVWLAATSAGLAVQPMSAGIYLFARLAGGGADLETADTAALGPLRARFAALFDVPADHEAMLLFRVAYADPPSARALRRPVDDVLSFDDGAR